MDKRRWGQWILLAVVCLSFSIGESYAQKNDFANLRRYSKENAALPQATKKDKRVIFCAFPCHNVLINVRRERFFLHICYCFQVSSKNTPYAGSF